MRSREQVKESTGCGHQMVFGANTSHSSDLSSIVKKPFENSTNNKKGK
jgi:hypothetical protein